MTQEILKKLGEMDGKLDQLLLWKAVHVEEHKTISKEVNEVRDTVYDNPGLKARVQTLWDCKKDVSKRREFWVRVLGIVIAALIIAVIMWGMSLYKGHRKEVIENITRTERTEDDL